MLRRPRARLAYATYETSRAEAVSRELQRLARDAGFKVQGTLGHWRIDTGATIKFVGMGGALTGEPVDTALIIDDPVKGLAEAQSAAYRAQATDWLAGVAIPRCHPGASIVVVQTRWHPDDLAGQCVRKGWDEINLPAINVDGLALWEARRPRAWLDEQRAMMGEFAFTALYLGRPRPRGGTVFRDVEFYDALPAHYRIGIGIDLAYTAKTHADYSTAVVLAESDGRYYVLDVRREQTDAPTFCGHLRALKAAYPGAQFWWYTSTTEKGSADLIRELSGVPLVGLVATTDKFMRAQPVAAAWNRGAISIPRAAPWVSSFVSEVCGFTGVGDDHDDQVDALAAAFDLLDKSNVVQLPRATKTAFTPYGGNPFAPGDNPKVNW